VQEEVLDGMKESLQKKKVEALLLAVERQVQCELKQDALQKGQDAADKESAHAALRDAVLPKGVTPDDIIQVQAYKKLKSERNSLLADIERVEREASELETQRAEQSASVDQCMAQVQQVSKELERSADLCSMVVP
jgi:hypothetical protein